MLTKGKIAKGHDPKIEQSPGHVWSKLRRSYETNAPGLVPFIIVLRARPVRHRSGSPSHVLRQNVPTVHIMHSALSHLNSKGFPPPGADTKGWFLTWNSANLGTHYDQITTRFISW